MLLFAIIATLIVALGVMFSLYIDAHGKSVRERHRADDAVAATMHLAAALAYGTRDRLAQILRGSDVAITVCTASRIPENSAEILHEVTVRFKHETRATLSVRFVVSSDGGQGWIHVSDNAMVSKTTPIENFLDAIEAAEASAAMHRGRIIDVTA